MFLITTNERKKQIDMLKESSKKTRKYTQRETTGYKTTSFERTLLQYQYNVRVHSPTLKKWSFKTTKTYKLPLLTYFFNDFVTF